MSGVSLWMMRRMENCDYDRGGGGGAQQHRRFAVTWQIAANGIALAMSLDWCVRAVVFYIRFRGGKWKNYQLI